MFDLLHFYLPSYIRSKVGRRFKSHPSEKVSVVNAGDILSSMTHRRVILKPPPDRRLCNRCQWSCASQPQGLQPRAACARFRRRGEALGDHRTDCGEERRDAAVIAFGIDRSGDVVADPSIDRTVSSPAIGVACAPAADGCVHHVVRPDLIAGPWSDTCQGGCGWQQCRLI